STARETLMRRSTLAVGALLLALAATLPAPAQANWQIIRWADGAQEVWVVRENRDVTFYTHTGVINKSRIVPKFRLR
ncbi:MAG: hypothetical protein ACKV2V_02310, partial [Blastocatellia bacterium]